MNHLRIFLFFILIGCFAGAQELVCNSHYSSKLDKNYSFDQNSTQVFRKLNTLFDNEKFNAEEFILFLVIKEDSKSNSLNKSAPAEEKIKLQDVPDIHVLDISELKKSSDFLTLPQKTQDQFIKIISKAKNIIESKSYKNTELLELMAYLNLQYSLISSDILIHKIKTCSLTKTQIAAIKLYTEGFYQHMNQLLRKNEEQIITGNYIHVMYNAFVKLAPFHGVVLRGTNASNYRAQYQKQSILTEKAFLSTSKSIPFPGSDQFKIASLSGRYIAPLSSHPDEDEVLFLPGTKFLVNESLIKKQDVNYEYELEEVK